MSLKSPKLRNLNWRLANFVSNTARNGNLEEPIYLLKAKQDYTARKVGKKDKWK
jgi:hypothetical protein